MAVAGGTWIGGDDSHQIDHYKRRNRIKRLLQQQAWASTETSDSGLALSCKHSQLRHEFYSSRLRDWSWKMGYRPHCWTPLTSEKSCPVCFQQFNSFAGRIQFLSPFFFSFFRIVLFSFQPSEKSSNDTHRYYYHHM